MAALIPPLLEPFCGTRKAGRLLLFLFMGLCCGTLSYMGAIRLEPQPGLPLDQVVQLRGSLRGDPLGTSGGGVLFDLKLRDAVGTGGIRTGASGVVRLFLSGGDSALEEAVSGMELSVECRAGSGDPPQLYAVPGTVRISGFSPAALGRKQLLHRLESTLGLPDRAGPLLAALLLGRKNDPSDPMFLLFRMAGASHILALSGMHVGILSGLFLLLLRPLVGKRMAKLLLLLLLPWYLLLTGFRPSLVRAILFTFLLTLVPRGREFPLRMLLFTFFIQIVIFPLSPRELSFQLSYLALGGILVFSRPLTHLLRSFHLPPGAAGPLAVSLAALVASAPLSVLLFGEIRPASLLSSLLLALPVLILIWTGLLFLFTVLLVSAIPGGAVMALFSGFASLLAALAEAAAASVLFLVEQTARIPPWTPPFAGTIILLTLTLVPGYLLLDGTPLGLRFSRFSPGLPGAAGVGNAETVWPELSHLPRSPGKDPAGPGTGG